MGASKLGDLHGISVARVGSLPGCGPRAIDELHRLIDRVSLGHFRAPNEPFSTDQVISVLVTLDSIIRGLPPRSFEILTLRLGADGGRGTLQRELARRFELTATAVGQTETRLAQLLPKLGGSRLFASLRGIAATCQQRVCPLTPALLVRWLTGRPGGFMFSPIFYVRLLGFLNPQIPAWPDAHAPRGNPDPQERMVRAALRRELEAHGTSLPLDVAFGLITSVEPLRTLQVVEFLNALLRTDAFVIGFAEPDRPVVGPCRRPARGSFGRSRKRRDAARLPTIARALSGIATGASSASPSMTMHTTPSAKQLYRAAKLRETIDRLTEELNGILGAPEPAAAKSKPAPKAERKRRFSKATLAKMAAAAKARWAEAKASGRKSLAAPRRKSK